MADIFLSYNREDQARAKMFADALAAAGFSVWWDVGLRTGEAYDEVTENALRAASAVVVLWSKKSVASRWVRAEATMALRNKTFLPCMIEPCDRPIMFELTQTADLSNWRGDADDPAWRAFLDDVRMFVSGDFEERAAFDEGRPAPGAPAMVRGVSRRHVLAAAGGSAVVGAIGFGVYTRITRAAELAENGIAVLPFRTIGGGGVEGELLSIGLRTALVRNPALRVIDQVSSEAVRARALNTAEIAKTLAVSYLLDGNVSIVGGAMRVGVQLSDTSTGFSRWSDNFERPVDELSIIQQAIAAAVTSNLSIDAASVTATDGYGESQNAEAMHNYFRGEYLYSSSKTTETDLAALDHINRAIELDPGFGAAYAAKARVLTGLGNTSDNVDDARQYYMRAKEVAHRAVEAGPNSADAYSTLGSVMFQALLDVAGAREPYQRSYELGRGDGVILARYAGFAASIAKFDEATKAVLRARELAPLNHTVHRAVGYVRYVTGRYRDAIEAVSRALELSPTMSDAHARIGMALIALGEPEKAVEAAEKERWGMMRYPCLAIAHRAAGNDGAADAAMASLIADYGDAGLYQQAQVLAQWGRADEAMAVLERALALGDSGLTYLYVDPMLTPIRGRKDCNLLLQRLGYV